MPRPARAPGRGEQLFADLTDHLRSRPGIEDGVMLHSPGLKVGSKFFAFVGSDDQLIVKLPRDRADTVVGDGRATPVTIGARTLREWVAFPFPAGHDEASWTTAIEEALAYVASLPAAPPRRRSRS